jgi:hypothetical protein
MNMQQINAFRIAHGLTPIVAQDKRAQKRAQDANRAARAQASRDLKSLRNRKGK